MADEDKQLTDIQKMEIMQKRILIAELKAIRSTNFLGPTPWTDAEMENLDIDMLRGLKRDLEHLLRSVGGLRGRNEL
jgi:hypothetical protein